MQSAAIQGGLDAEGGELHDLVTRGAGIVDDEREALADEDAISGLDDAARLRETEAEFGEGHDALREGGALRECQRRAAHGTHGRHGKEQEQGGFAAAEGGEFLMHTRFAQACVHEGHAEQLRLIGIDREIRAGRRDEL